ncbi:hypothetical protein HELRODRAFT_159716 [Helobdella robusta]|uniref:Uncharacterized protein n=1 Tax=Helobdella robusta TaxID=6412 RepID=T1EPC3_HELRO|nr:hypothetical protein HELRODRAFT_159716 [Helobdella robusta]ESO13107.1 hypothetical protein HELRODRAFT_159716 [Helobdella robusta]
MTALSLSARLLPFYHIRYITEIFGRSVGKFDGWLLTNDGRQNIPYGRRTYVKYLLTTDELPTGYLAIRLIIQSPRIKVLCMSLKHTGPGIWETIPQEIKDCNTLHLFKNKLKNFLITKTTIHPHLLNNNFNVKYVRRVESCGVVLNRVALCRVASCRVAWYEYKTFVAETYSCKHGMNRHDSQHFN